MTSVRPTPITVTSMLFVIIPRDIIIAPVSPGTLEMEVIALVMICFYSLFVSLYMIEAYTSRLNFVIEIKSVYIKLVCLHNLVQFGRALARITGILPRQSLWSSIAVLNSPIAANPVSSRVYVHGPRSSSLSLSMLWLPKHKL